MFSKSRIFTIQFLIIALIGCNSNSGPNDSSSDSTYDKQVRLKFDGGLTTIISDYKDVNYYSSLIRFNIDYYPIVDSVIFSTLMSTEDSTNNCIVDLYNYTDGVEIANSEISTSSKKSIWVSSGNLLDKLPHKEITLLARVKSENGTSFVKQSLSYIFIYRH